MACDMAFKCFQAIARPIWRPAILTRIRDKSRYMTVDNEQALHNARSLTEAGQHDDARLCLLKFLEQEPDNATALMMLGGAYFQMQKFAEAEMVFERLVLMEPGRGEYSIALFNTLWKMERHEEGLEEIKRFMTCADQTRERATLAQYVSVIDQFY